MAAGSPLLLCVTDHCIPRTPQTGPQVNHDIASFSYTAILCACDAPTRLHFAELNEEHSNALDFSVGKTVQYTCHPGYAKVPGMSPTITCLESQVWSEALEFCKILPQTGVR
uniref:Sushi domain-containing protein n=1 Tax=Malurus cyaneus samueli TaxID=2593467 RepID=A0A8C5TWY4_9PASS